LQDEIEAVELLLIEEVFLYDLNANNIRGEETDEIWILVTNFWRLVEKCR
jgi:hypothetical protein